MELSKKDESTLQLLVYQLNKYHIPRIQRMLDRLEKGETLTDQDIQHLKHEYDQNMKSWRLVEKNPKYLNLAVRYVELYTAVISRALENEEGGKA